MLHRSKYLCFGQDLTSCCLAQGFDPHHGCISNKPSNTITDLTVLASLGKCDLFADAFTDRGPPPALFSRAGGLWIASLARVVVEGAPGGEDDCSGGEGEEDAERSPNGDVLVLVRERLQHVDVDRVPPKKKRTKKKVEMLCQQKEVSRPWLLGLKISSLSFVDKRKRFASQLQIQLTDKGQGQISHDHRTTIRRRHPSTHTHTHTLISQLTCTTWNSSWQHR